MRLGRFYVTGEFYRNPLMMITMQRDMAILNVRIASDRRDCYEFMATGEMFDDVETYAYVPEYQVHITSDVEMEVKFVRIGDL